jgi:peptide/nickel transport system permease protein
MAESTKGAPEILAVGNAKKPAKGINVEDTVKTYWATVFSRFLRHKVAVGSIFMIVLLALLAIFADVISSLTGLDPSSQKILQRYGEWTAANPLGTDELGRDAFIRLLYGARVSLAVAMLSALASMFIGIIVGSLAGFYGGKLDTILMRVTDSFLALPLIPFLILMAAMDFGKIPYLGAYMQGDEGSILKLIIIFVSFSW